MGRKKVELKRIEDKSSRQVTFSKRRNGLIKKARELSVLCDVDVALLVFSSRGKFYHFSSPNNLDGLLQRYRRLLEEDDNTNTANAETTDLMPYSNMLEIIHRCLGDLDDVPVSELVHLEKKLDTALAQTRSRKTEVMMESVVSLQEREKLLEAERDELQRQIQAMEEENNNNYNIVMENNSNETETSSKRATLSLLHL